MCKWKWITAFVAGGAAAGIARDRINWALRRRADESGYAAELFMRLAKDPAALGHALALVPEATFCFCGKQEYCTALKALADSARCTDSAQAEAEITLLPADRSLSGRPCYWLPALLDESESKRKEGMREGGYNRVG